MLKQNAAMAVGGRRRCSQVGRRKIGGAKREKSSREFIPASFRTRRSSTSAKYHCDEFCITDVPLKASGQSNLA